MARRALDYELHSKTARLKLAPRRKPYYRQIAPGLTLGYMRRASGPGAWQRRELEAGVYRYRVLGAADDVGQADGRDVLTFDQAQRKAGAPSSPVAAIVTVRQAIETYV